MADVTIKVRDNGPYIVSGDVELVDAEGNRFETKPKFSLCRCRSIWRTNLFVTALTKKILKVVSGSIIPHQRRFRFPREPLYECSVEVMCCFASK